MLAFRGVVFADLLILEAETMNPRISDIDRVRMYLALLEVQDEKHVKESVVCEESFRSHMYPSAN